MYAQRPITYLSSPLSNHSQSSGFSFSLLLISKPNKKLIRNTTSLPSADSLGFSLTSAFINLFIDLLHSFIPLFFLSISHDKRRHVFFVLDYSYLYFHFLTTMFLCIFIYPIFSSLFERAYTEYTA